MDVIAFYLPQYHVIPENEAIYGKGFTEWDNVRRARPLFPGHCQPHVPHPSIGYYSLLDERFLAMQHAMAFDFGVTGFCYYYYNFAGHRPLSRPLELIAANRDICNKFCLCWPHGSWYNNRTTHREVFLPQRYSPANAKILFDDVRPYLEHPRHICIDGKPLLLIWAPERHPMLREYAEIWREQAHKAGFPGLWLAGVECYQGSPPSMFGLDGMVEFAPNWRPENHVSAPGEEPTRLDYIGTVRFMAQKEIPDYPRLRCTFPGWDNTPRRGRQGIACVNDSPELFQASLRFMLDYTQTVLPASLHYVFINAWNEWGEGCHLEPDQQHGFKYVQIIQEELARIARRPVI